MAVLEVACDQFTLPVSRYTFTLRAVTPGRLPSYLGSTLRGAFGHAFRRMSCATGMPTCEGCPILADCPYPALFEPSPPEGSDRLRNLNEIPRPFVFVPPPWKPEVVLRPGDELEWQLTLFGKAAQWFPWFVVAVKEMGAAGLGRGRTRGEGCCRLELITTLERSLVYSAEDGKVRDHNSCVRLWDMMHTAPDAAHRVSLVFLTPFRARSNGQVVARPDFHVLFRSVITRLSNLSYFYDGGHELGIDFRGLLDRARQVRIVSDHRRWADWDRYSSRQDRRMPFGGLVGRVSFEGDIAPFLPYLVAGQYLHVGKNTTFGLGRYVVEQ